MKSGWDGPGRIDVLPVLFQAPSRTPCGSISSARVEKSISVSVSHALVNEGKQEVEDTNIHKSHQCFRVVVGEAETHAHYVSMIIHLAPSTNTFSNERSRWQTPLGWPMREVL